MQINHVGPVPPSYYVRDHIKVDYECCVTVNRGSSQQLDYEILFPGCVLRSVWQLSLRLKWPLFEWPMFYMQYKTNLPFCWCKPRKHKYFPCKMGNYYFQLLNLLQQDQLNVYLWQCYCFDKRLSWCITQNAFPVFNQSDF